MAEPLLADWLALRQALDHAARSEALTRAIADVLPKARPLRILDLGAGTGSNIRYLSRRLPHSQRWMAVDQDQSLLTRVPAGVDTRCVELGAIDDLDVFDGVHLVTASALLDLVSSDWIARLARRCGEVGAATLFALNYNGWSACAPADPDDQFVLDQFNRHQRSNDKGFGRAAGPDAADAASRSFAGLGYQVRTDRSDWHLTTDMVELQMALIEGWAHAATEIAPADAERVAAWRVRRLAHVRAGRSRIEVGHLDVGCWPK